MSDRGRLYILGDSETWDQAFTRLRETPMGRKRDPEPLPEVRTMGGGEAVTPDGKWGMVDVEGEGWDLIAMATGDVVASHLRSLDSCRRRILNIERGE